MGFNKILIANRGEIAVRIIQACKQMGIKTVAVYSEADFCSRHVHEADEAYCIGAALPAESYLKADNILAVAKEAGVDAIHPGYGFLAENPDFALACEDNGFTFIGPRPAAMRLMSSKIDARRTAIRFGVPVVPGTTSPVRSKKEAVRMARKIGYPVLVKPSAGGGGRGLRVAHNEHELFECLSSAEREASMSFNSAGIFLERYLERSRHIEVQVLADSYGNVVHLGERDCTIQRRYQKLIEESPSPAVDEDLRAKIVAAAVRLAVGINYNNAGTVEFVLDPEGNFYFIEMNTRIQVEHPVTEMVTGIDIVKEQIRIAAGEQLGFEQDDINLNGWAIECRINAEDPAQNFFPCPGTITLYEKPDGEGIRIDDYIYSGYTLPFFYDSLLGKVIAWGETREEAVSRMKKALSEFRIGGIKTTLPFHLRVLNHPSFAHGDVCTTFAEELVNSHMSFQDLAVR